ncbi:MAG: TetR/AcrR family transcriptional regulator [Deltaproteobacteria bacterium]|nr:TetR/AcrR family transcriptional regulator [Deltaproteobacteria bacterium]
MTDLKTEKAILDAALAEFAEKGFHGARMQTIANRAGANKALVHYYYRSKEQLYLTALTLISVAFREAVDSQIHRLAVGDIRGLAKVLATFVVTETQKAPYSKILITELAVGGPYLKKLSALFVEALGEQPNAVQKFIQKGITAGKIKPAHPMKIFSCLMGMCWNIFLMAPIADVFYERDGVHQDASFFTDYIELISEMAASGLGVNG